MVEELVEIISFVDEMGETKDLEIIDRFQHKNRSYAIVTPYTHRELKADDDLDFYIVEEQCQNDECTYEFVADDKLIAELTEKADEILCPNLDYLLPS